MREKFKNWLYKNILPAAGWLAISGYSKILRKKVYGKKSTEEIIRSGKRVIFAVIHGRQFMVYNTLGYRGLCVMSSTSRDGRLQADVLKRFGFNVAFGSSSSSPVRALVGMIKLMQKGHNGIMAVDGPKGPIYKVKPGILFLAKKTDAVIIPYVFSANRAVIMKAWDKYMLPKPFSKTVVFFGEPYLPSRENDKNTIKKESEELEKILLDNMERADLVSGWKSNEW